MITEYERDLKYICSYYRKGSNYFLFYKWYNYKLYDYILSLLEPPF